MPANVQDRAQFEHLAAQVKEMTGDSVRLAYVDPGYTGASPAAAVQAQGRDVVVVKLAEARGGVVLLPRR